MTEIDRKLYELFADKTLSEGCMLMSYELQTPVLYLYSTISHYVCWHNKSLGSEEFITTTILGHPPQLHDVFRVSLGMPYGDKIEIQSRGKYFLILDRDIALRTERINIPYNPTLPLLCQSDETKEQIISLFLGRSW